MEFYIQAKKIAAESFMDETEKKKIQAQEKKEFFSEIDKIDSFIKERMRFLGKLFFKKFFVKNYKLSFIYDEISWYMHGHIIMTDIYINISVKFRENLLYYCLTYLNDDIDQYKEFQLNGKTKNSSIEEIDRFFILITDKIARSKAKATEI